MATTTGTHLDANVKIHVMEPLRAVNAALLELLDGLETNDWNRPTVHRDRTVKDLAAHLLHGSIRRVSGLRDAYRVPNAPHLLTAEELTQFIQEDNRVFMNAMRGVSPRILREQIQLYDPELIQVFEKLDPDAMSLGVVWAGEWQSKNWFDVAREYTEKWHHQQQLRDATGRPSLYEPALLAPAVETFARGLPFAYRNLEAPEGTSVTLSTGGPPGIPSWSLRRTAGAWSLWSGTDSNPDTSIVADPSILWRLWTKGLAPATARHNIHITGSTAYAEPLLNFVAIMA